MQFASLTFGVFLLAVVVGFHVLQPSPARVRWFVVAASLVFYASWSLAYVPVLLGSSLVAFFTARAMASTEDATRKRRWLIAGVTIELATLATFKYVNVLVGNVLISPIGISFYTFVNIAYLVDVYRKQVEAKRGVIEYLAPMTFFPHLLSGPIVRAPQLFPQFDRPAGVSAKMYRLAILLLFVGLAKKALAGMLDPLASEVFDSSDPVGAVQAWTGVLAYAAELYADFSGYTDIAIGVALLVGIELPANFNLPFLASSPIDFWRRWHITLSSWIHDYAFLPIVRRLRLTYVSLLVTWILVGVWHGARWTYVAYGLYHGTAIIVTRWIGLRVPDSVHDRADAWPLLAVRRLVTFVVVVMSFVVFRSSHVVRAGEIVAELFVPSTASIWNEVALFNGCVIVCALVIPHALDAALQRRERITHGVAFWSLAIFAAAFSILFGMGSAAYIYFGF